MAVSGLGNTGLNVVQQLVSASLIDSLQVYDPAKNRMERAMEIVGSTLHVVAAPIDETLDSSPEPSVAILCGPAGTHLNGVEQLVERGCSIVSLSDHPTDVKALLQLNDRALASGSSVVAGAGFSPGLSTLLASLGASQLDTVEAIMISTTGTGGPACARQHHRALKQTGLEWSEGVWLDRRGRSGRDLVWFPEPIGARDCYRAALADPLLIQLALPETSRIGARMSANRRDRLTSRLPMLRRPHADGGLGAIRAEIRGIDAGGIETLIYGVVAQPSFAAAAVAALCAKMLTKYALPSGAYGLASLPDPASFLLELYKQGIVVSSFDGFLASAVR